MNVREAVHDRQRGYCWWCGVPLPEAWALHHRQLRSQGGTDDVWNFVALHHACHNGHRTSVHSQVAQAIERGFIVSSWDDPALVSLRLLGGETVSLHSDGTSTREGHHGW